MACVLATVAPLHYTTLFRSDKLAEHELLSVSYERLGKRRGQGGGRPAKLYSRPPREFTVSVPPRDYLLDRKSTRLNYSHRCISYAVFGLKNKTKPPEFPVPE